MDNLNIQLEQVVDELLEFGEDREEMNFWKKVFSTLSAAEQQQLLSKLQNELQNLKNISS